MKPADRMILWRMFRFLMRMLLGLALNSSKSYFERVRKDYFQFRVSVEGSTWRSWDWDEDIDG